MITIAFSLLLVCYPASLPQAANASNHDQPCQKPLLRFPSLPFCLPFLYVSFSIPFLPSFSRQPLPGRGAVTGPCHAGVTLTEVECPIKSRPGSRQRLQTVNPAWFTLVLPRLSFNPSRFLQKNVPKFYIANRLLALWLAVILAHSGPKGNKLYLIPHFASYFWILVECIVPIRSGGSCITLWDRPPSLRCAAPQAPHVDRYSPDAAGEMAGICVDTLLSVGVGLRSNN